MLAIIPARGGTKGLPGKNIRKLNGIPMIAYTIRAAFEAKEINRVVVHTDSEEIAKVSIEYGAEVPFLRPKALAQDDSFILDNYIYAIDRINREEKIDISSFAALQPTSPFRSSKDIDNAIQLFKEKNADSVISFTKEKHPITWNRYLNEDGKFYSVLPEIIDNRQMYQPSYYFNGAVYIYKTSVVKKKIMYTNNSYAYIMPGERSIDIDAMEDFEYAEYLLKKRSINRKE